MIPKPAICRPALFARPDEETIHSFRIGGFKLANHPHRPPSRPGSPAPAPSRPRKPPEAATSTQPPIRPATSNPIPLAAGRHVDANARLEPRGNPLACAAPRRVPQRTEVQSVTSPVPSKIATTRHPTTPDPTDYLFTQPADTVSALFQRVSRPDPRQRGTNPLETPKPLNVAFQSDAIQSHYGEGNRDSHLLEPDGPAESHGMEVRHSFDDIPLSGYLRIPTRGIPNNAGDPRSAPFPLHEDAIFSPRIGRHRPGVDRASRC